MKISSRTPLLIYLLLTFPLSMAYAQTTYQSVGGVKLVINGTSNVHDWNMKSDQGTCSSLVEVTKAGTLKGVSSINFTVPAESLRSFSTYMDKKAYKALHTDKYNTISFSTSAIHIKPNGITGHIITAKGKLTISNTTKEVMITAIGNLNADKSITYTGVYKLNITDYNVEPPAIMDGAVKSSEFITIQFDLLLKSV